MNFKKTTNYFLDFFLNTKSNSLVYQGLFLWLISFIYGFLYTNINRLQKTSLYEFYFDSWFVVFNVVYGIIAICLLIVFFYKNKKTNLTFGDVFYTKSFLVYFFSFFLLISAYIPFTIGTISRTKTIYKNHELLKEIDAINLASSFFISDSYHYKLFVDNYNIKQGSILNFSHFQVGEYYVYDYYKKYRKSDNYENRYKSTILKWIREKDTLAISNSINKFKRICSKYQIYTNINTIHLVHYLNKKEYKDFYKTVINYKVNTKNLLFEQNKIRNSLKNDSMFLKVMEAHKFYCYDHHGIQFLFYNFTNSTYNIFSLTSTLDNNQNYLYQYLSNYLFIALSLAWLIVGLSIFSLKTLAKSILIILIIYGLLLLYVLTDGGFYFKTDTSLFDLILSIMIIVAFIVIILNLFINFLNIKLAKLLMSLFYVLMPGIALFLIQKVVVYSLNSIDIFLSLLLGIVLYFPLVKKWKSLNSKKNLLE